MSRDLVASRADAQVDPAGDGAWSTRAREVLVEAEARLESAKRDANAQVMLAEASAESIRRVTAGIGDQAGPMMYLLGEKYIGALEKLGDSGSAKIVVMPADLQETLRGLVGRLGARG